MRDEANAWGEQTGRGEKGGRTSSWRPNGEEEEEGGKEEHHSVSEYNEFAYPFRLHPSLPFLLFSLMQLQHFFGVAKGSMSKASADGTLHRTPTR